MYTHAETELMLQPVVQFIVIAHAFVAALTAREAQAKGVDVPSSILKVSRLSFCC